jgi:hypothetical protein
MWNADTTSPGLGPQLVWHVRRKAQLVPIFGTPTRCGDVPATFASRRYQHQRAECGPATHYAATRFGW